MRTTTATALIILAEAAAAWGQAVEIRTDDATPTSQPRMQFATGAAPATITVINSRMLFSSAFFTLPTDASSNTTAGNIYYDSSTGRVLYRDGTGTPSWRTLSYDNGSAYIQASPGSAQTAYFNITNATGSTVTSTAAAAGQPGLSLYNGTSGNSGVTRYSLYADVSGTGTSTTNIGASGSSSGGGSANYGLRGATSGTTGETRAVYATDNATTASTNHYGIYAETTGAANGATKIGVYGTASGAGTGTTTNYGLYGTASGATTTNYGVYGSAWGATTNYGVYGFSSGSGYAGLFNSDSSTTAAAISVVSLQASTSGTAAAGLGAKLNFFVEADNGTLYEQGSLRTVFTSAAGTGTSDLVFATSGGDRLRLVSDGTLRPETTGYDLGSTSYRWDLLGGTGDFSGLMTGTAGLTVTGGTVSLNASSNSAVNIATGSSTGAITIGGNANTVYINSSDWDISTTGDMTGIGGITADGILTQTYAGTSTAYSLTANSVTTGTVMAISATGLTTGKAFSITGTANLGSAQSAYGAYVDLTSSASATGANAYAVWAKVTDASTQPTDDFAVRGEVSDTGVTAASTKNVYGGWFKSTKTGITAAVTSNAYGVRAESVGDTGGTSTAYGVYATASGADTFYAGYFTSNPTSSGSNIVHVTGTSSATSGNVAGIESLLTNAPSGTSATVQAIHGKVSDAGQLTDTKYGVFGEAIDTGTPGTAITKTLQGGRFYASFSTSGSLAGTYNAYGVYAEAEGITSSANVAETAYGIYAKASGADTNWAGYFAGNVNVENTISLNYSTITPTAGSTVTPTRSYHRLNPASAVTLSATTAIAGGTDGQILVLRGYSDTNTTTINDGANVELGAATRVLGLYDTLVLIYDSFSGIWIELSYVNN